MIDDGDAVADDALVMEIEGLAAWRIGKAVHHLEGDELPKRALQGFRETGLAEVFHGLCEPGVPSIDIGARPTGSCCHVHSPPVEEKT
ncbi:hypothetical protein D9M72_577370 [compost metagenome]